MRAAQYLRMSTERQDYSIPNQLAAIEAYAVLHSFEIVKTYSDPGKSGVDLARRPGLQSLLQDATNATSEFEVILVYDVTRWGRFQDIDESAYYEFLCKRAGIRVHYCAEPFSCDDASVMAALLKAIKRVMAGEYLRELSMKVIAGQCRIARSGYKLGGTAGYGLRRLLISRDGVPKQILANGERKSLATDRVIYVPGPPEEVEVVRQIYSWFLDENHSADEIARLLNKHEVRRDSRGSWDKYAVNAILNHPKYSGCVMFNRTSRRLGAKNTRNPVDQWIVTPNSFEAIVAPERFAQVRNRRRPMLDRPEDELIADLRKILQIHGRLTLKTIRATPNVISPWVYAARFGSMAKAYELAGFKAVRGHFAGCLTRKNTQQMKPSIVAEITKLFREAGRRTAPIARGVKVSGLGCVGIELAQWQFSHSGKPRWEVRTGKSKRYRQMVVARISLNRTVIEDYLYLNIVPITKCNFRITDRMLADCPRGTSDHIVSVITSTKYPSERSLRRQ
jgi:DNA invertase Pin-like site-specific DNA recombinase